MILLKDAKKNKKKLTKLYYYYYLALAATSSNFFSFHLFILNARILAAEAAATAASETIERANDRIKNKTPIYIYLLCIFG